MGLNKPMCRLTSVLCFLSLALMVALATTMPTYAQEDDEGSWALLQSGNAVALMRHALAPGTGDPPGFELGDCSTQRTLSEEGRQQARALGELFRAQGISKADVRSSRWCRSLETAELLELGEVRKAPFLDSFFRNRERGVEQTEAARTFIRAHLDRGERPLVLVTHQVNITALSGVYPASGEIVLLRQDPDSPDLKVEGRIKQDF